jgi:hypothetical protein
MIAFMSKADTMAPAVLPGKKLFEGGRGVKE